MMQWFRNLKTSGKLLVFSLLMIAIMGVIGWMGLSTSQQINQSTEIIYNKCLRSTYNIEEARANFIRCRVNLYNYLLTKDEALIDRFNELAVAMDENLVEYEKNITHNEDREMYRVIRELKSNYFELAKRIFAVAKNEVRNVTLQEALADGRKANDALRDQFDKMVEFNTRSAAVEKKKSESTFKSAFLWLLTIGLIGMAVALAVSVFISSLISKPLVAVVGNIKQMAQGDFTAELEVNTHDEVGDMVRELNRMKDSLSDLIARVLESSGRVQTGSHEIAMGNQDLSQRTQEQASTLEEVASTIEEITSSIQQTAANSGQADQISQTTLSAVREGEKVIEETMEAMKQISVSSKQIADIIKVVNDIAFQTNLLALNAAVEAARAGEQGRGFAVVAAEVRNLAGRTAESSKEIEKLIKESVDRVEKGNNLVQQSGEMLQQIVQNTKHTSDVVVEIASAVKEQAGAAEQIQSAIEQLNQVTQQNASMVEEIASSSESLNAEAEGLSDMVSVFRIKGQETSFGRERKNGSSRTKRPVGNGPVKDKVQLAQSFKDDDFEQF